MRDRSTHQAKEEGKRKTRRKNKSGKGIFRKIRESKKNHKIPERKTHYKEETGPKTETKKDSQKDSNMVEEDMKLIKEFKDIQEELRNIRTEIKELKNEWKKKEEKWEISEEVKKKKETTL